MSSKPVLPVDILVDKIMGLKNFVQIAGVQFDS